MDEIKILSMNCRGLGEQKKRRDVLNYISQFKFSVIFLQDTHMTERALPYFNNLWKGTCYHSCYSSRSRGTCILISKNTHHDVLTQISSDCGNYVILMCKIHTDVFAFVNIYGPNSDQPNLFTDVFDQLKDIEVDHIIVAGDMNFVINQEIDSLNYARENNRNAKQTFLQYANEYSLIDVWRYFNPSERKYTWTRKNPFKCGRLDMFFVSESLVPVTTDTTIIPGYKTDHNAISLKVKTKQQPRGNGLWMFNTSHLLSEEYVSRIKACIVETVKQYAVPLYQETYFFDAQNYNAIHLTITDCLFYETLIMMLRGESIKYSKQNAKRFRAREDELKREIDIAQEQFDSTTREEDLHHLEMVKIRLEEFRRPKIEGLIVRSRVQWYEDGERSSKYFLS